MKTKWKNVLIATAIFPLWILASGTILALEKLRGNKRG